VAGKSLKSAPRRSILKVEKRGDWGEVTYLHHLTCGHIEVRKRHAAGSVMACSGCVTAANFAAGNLPEPPSRDLHFDGSIADPLAMAETEVAHIKAGLVSTFGIHPDAIDVAVGASNEVKYVLVFLDSDSARRLAKLEKH